MKCNAGLKWVKICSNSVFLTQIISRRQKMPMRNLYYRFHLGKNGIREGNFQKIVFFQIFNKKGVVNRLPRFKNLSDHTNKFLMG